MDKKKDTKARTPEWDWIVRNLVKAVIFVAAVVLLSTVSLNLITHHNREIEVPDFTNMSFQEARKAASSAGLSVLVEDSIYVRRLKPGVVYMQTPKAGEHVKKGRRIRVTTNTMVVKMVPMPSLVGFSMRQAKGELSRAGLVLGKLIYTRDIATNNVLRQQYRGADIKPGKMVQSGSTINLVVGLNSNDSQTYVPSLVGKQYLRAVDLLQENSLNVGTLKFDKDIKTYADSVSAVVYSQKPLSTAGAVKMGTEVTLYLTTDESKYNAD